MLAEKVREVIASVEAISKNEAVLKAERMADQFADVAPVPFAIRAERFPSAFTQTKVRGL